MSDDQEDERALVREAIEHWLLDALLLEREIARLEVEHHGLAPSAPTQALRETKAEAHPARERRKRAARRGP